MLTRSQKSFGEGPAPPKKRFPEKRTCEESNLSLASSVGALRQGNGPVIGLGFALPYLQVC
jgi:hypothetical protein